MRQQASRSIRAKVHPPHDPRLASVTTRLATKLLHKPEPSPKAVHELCRRAIAVVEELRAIRAEIDGRAK